MKSLREALKAELGKRGIKFSYMPLIIKATSMVSPTRVLAVFSAVLPFFLNFIAICVLCLVHCFYSVCIPHL